MDENKKDKNIKIALVIHIVFNPNGTDTNNTIIAKGFLIDSIFSVIPVNPFEKRRLLLTSIKGSHNAPAHSICKIGMQSAHLSLSSSKISGFERIAIPPNSGVKKYASNERILKNISLDFLSFDCISENNG